MSLKARMNRIEAARRKAGADHLPIAIIDGDNVLVAGEQMTLAEYRARYDPLIEEAIAAGTTQAFFGVNFNP